MHLPVQLSQKVVVITGGGRGIGRSIALACASAGADVVVSARSKIEIESVASEIAHLGKGRSLAIACDVSSSESVGNLFTQTEKHFGPVFGLICAAGVYGAIGPFDETSFEEWEEGVRINLIGTARCMHEALKGMRKRKSGRVILFSGGGQAAMPCFSSYVTGKGGIWRLTETLGAEYAPHGVWINAVTPGAVNTKFLDDLLAAGPVKVGQEFYQKSLKQRDEGGVPPQKAAELVMYLLGPDSIGLSGRTLSAIWDSYREIKDAAAVSKTDLYTMKRVVTPEGGTRN